jgi:N-acetyl-alpha-D-muramate 1-phosphate uridylyltransferase
MILAAGLGTRLGDLTKSIPKALVPLAGVSMLERVARRLVEAGADRLIINTHHFSERIVGFVQQRNGFGVDVVFSHEPNYPLETGGGLRRAAPLFESGEPFFLHNVDIFTDLPLESLYSTHLVAKPLATLAVMARPSTRYLLFDDRGLMGRVDEKKEIRIEARKAQGEVKPFAFGGVHVLSPEIFGLLQAEDDEVFSILQPYLRAVGRGRRINPYRVDGYEWIDIGKPEELAEAARRLEAI